MAGVTSKGYEYTSLPDRLAALRQKLLPLGLTFAPGTPESALTYALAEAIDDQALELRDLAALLAPSQRVGIWLDDAAAMLGITRSSGTYSSVVLTVTGTGGTVVSAGSITVTGPDGTVWTQQNAVTLSAGGAGSVTALAGTLGAVEAPAATLLKTTGLPSGVTQVTNANDATVGTAADTDETLWQAMRDRVAVAGATTYDALWTALYGPGSYAGCSDVRIFWNDTGVDDADGRPAGSVEVVTVGGNAVRIAQAIWAHACGLERVSLGQSSVTTVADAAGGTHDILHSYASEVAITVAITVQVGAGWPRTASVGVAQVKAAIVAYFKTLRIGGTVVDLYVRREVSRVVGVIGIAALTYNGGSGAASGDYVPESWQICRVVTGRIAVTVT